MSKEVAEQAMSLTLVLQPCPSFAITNNASKQPALA